MREAREKELKEGLLERSLCKNVLGYSPDFPIIYVHPVIAY